MAMLAKNLHSIRGASSAERWRHCPASVLATEHVIEMKSEYAILGSAAHTVSEWVRLQEKPALEFITERVIVPWGDNQKETIIVDQEMVDGVQNFVDFVNKIPGKGYYELMIEYGEYVEGGFGTLDDARLGRAGAVITDFKYGEGHMVFAKENWQLMIYALGCYIKFKDRFKFKNFILNIHQPRLDHIDPWEISLKDLLEWANDELIPAGKRTFDPQAPFKAGDWCQFCKIAATCKVRAEHIMLNPAEEFENLDQAIDSVSIGAVVPQATLSNDEVARILSIKPMVASWYKALERHALQELAKGNPIGDWKIVEGRSTRKYNLDPDEVAIALQLEGLRTDEIWLKELISPAQLEKKLGKKSPVIEDLFYKPPGAPTLVPGGDRREPMTLKPELEFDKIGDDDGDES